jgi:hypothetical protein
LSCDVEFCLWFSSGIKCRAMIVMQFLEPWQHSFCYCLIVWLVIVMLDYDAIVSFVRYLPFDLLIDDSPDRLCHVDWLQFLPQFSYPQNLLCHRCSFHKFPVVHWWMIFSNTFINCIFNFKLFDPQIELNSWLFARSTRSDRVS